MGVLADKSILLFMFEHDDLCLVSREPRVDHETGFVPCHLTLDQVLYDSPIDIVVLLVFFSSIYARIVIDLDD